MKNSRSKEITIETSTYEIIPLHYAVAQQIKRVSAELEILKLTRERDLTRTERWQLPGNLQLLSREELIEQIDPWVSMLMDCQYWAQRFEEIDSSNEKESQNGHLGKSVGQKLDSKARS